MDRRSFLKITPGALAGASFLGGCAVGGATTAEAQQSASHSKKKPKNIIFLVSDGMSWSVPTIAEMYSYVFRSKHTQFATMMQDPEVTLGYYDTQSLSSMVTDSAAGGSAWGCGSRINNGALNMLPDGTELTSIGELAQASGRKVGLVTTTTLPHATPASFCVSHPSRGDLNIIAGKMIEHTDFLMGGGWRNFDDSTIANYKNAGYTYIKSKKDFSKLSKDKKTLGIFSNYHMPYTVDHVNDPKLQAEVPTLAEMTSKAIEHLKGQGEGFMLQVEGGRVDHAAHGNDAGSIFTDQIAFDDAIEVAMNFARENGDTLVVVTTDHTNANPALNGIGSGYSDATKGFERLAECKGSFEKLNELVDEAKSSGQQINVDFAHDLGERLYGIDLTSNDSQHIADAINGNLPNEINFQQRRQGGIIAQVLGNYTGIQFTGNSHTNDYVALLAYGPGSHLFRGLQPNTNAFGAMTGLWDINHVNPVASKKYIPSLDRKTVMPQLFQDS